MKNVIKVIISIAIIGLLSVVGLSSVSAMTLQEGAEAARCDGCPTDLFGDNGAFKQITNTVLYIVGIIAVIMLIIGGIRYVISGGDSKKVTDAKNTVLYAIIGLVICFFSYAIVNFVITSLPSTENPAKVNESKNDTSLLIDSTES
jgi:amino acid transporter